MTDLLDAEAVRRMLVAVIGAVGTQSAFADRHGISAAYVSEVVRGTRDPGPAVLDALGLERVVGSRRKALI